MRHFRKFIIVFSALMFSFATYANMNDEVVAIGDSGKHSLESVPNADISNLKTNSLKTQGEYKPLIDTIMQQATANLPQKQQLQPVPNAILFVSFSMPDSLLFALADEAAQYHIPVVIRGLIQNDFKQTVETFARLNRDAKKQNLNFSGVSIDPIWFQQFNITAVPALVVNLRPENCAQASLCPNLPFDVVYGNAHLKKSLELIAERGESAALVAKHILEQGYV